MKGTHLGEFEELVLLTSALLVDTAYSVTIADEIEKHTQRNVTLSTVHTALYRLEKKGWLQSDWGLTETNRQAKFYSLSEEGREHLSSETARWTTHTSAVQAVLDAVRN